MIDTMTMNLQYVTDITGKPTAVIVPIEEFQGLLEDLSDLAAITERRDEPTISHQTLLAELKTQG
ncbi:MAG: hypothetical protein KBG20_04625 [Caldilineaceae bacterium]|nr:hypothetical protein [Caldilineaceae bacterium]MBP8106233.1 hypothetical protein [Caldilineaceae bacterium]MBP8121164.1 hypothetical protein [Caldilineaceae bacterium]MBP9071557.1 hypothetical protein [Caldilineaceae bacterium]